MGNARKGEGPAPEVLVAAYDIAAALRPLVLAAAERIAADHGSDPLLVATAIAEVMAQTTVRAGVARDFALEAQVVLPQGTIAQRAAIGELVGMTRQGVEARLALTGPVAIGSPPRTAAQVVMQKTAEQYARLQAAGEVPAAHVAEIRRGKRPPGA